MKNVILNAVVLSLALSASALADETLKFPAKVTCTRRLPAKTSDAPKTIVVELGENPTLGGAEAYATVFNRQGSEPGELKNGTAEESDKVTVSEYHDSHDWSHIEFFAGNLAALAAGQAKSIYATYVEGFEWGTESITGQGIYECK